MLPCRVVAQKRHRGSVLCVSQVDVSLMPRRRADIKILRTFCPEGWNFHNACQSLLSVRILGALPLISMGVELGHW